MIFPASYFVRTSNSSSLPFMQKGPVHDQFNHHNIYYCAGYLRHHDPERQRPGAARTILLFHIISARLPKQPLFFSHAALGWRMHLGVEVTELSINKQHHVSLEPPRKSAKPRRNRRVSGDNRRPRPGTDVRVSPGPAASGLSA